MSTTINNFLFITYWAHNVLNSNQKNVFAAMIDSLECWLTWLLHCHEHGFKPLWRLALWAETVTSLSKPCLNENEHSFLGVARTRRAEGIAQHGHVLLLAGRLEWTRLLRIQLIQGAESFKYVMSARWCWAPAFGTIRKEMTSKWMNKTSEPFPSKTDKAAKRSK